MTITSHESCLCRVREDSAPTYRLADGREIADLDRAHVESVLAVFECYAGSPNVSREDAMAHAIVELRACREREIAAGRRAARIREIATRTRVEMGSRLS